MNIVDLIRDIAATIRKYRETKRLADDLMAQVGDDLARAMERPR